MKKYILLVALIAGCTPANDQMQPISVFPPTNNNPAVPLPEAPRIDPVTPKVDNQVPHSYEWQGGYWDGYTGKWLGPFKWVFSTEYRNGHQNGARDRQQGLKPQIPK